MRFGLDVDGHTATMIAVLGFDHHRQTQGASSGPAFFGALNLAAIGHRYARGLQELFGELFVLGDGLRDGAGPVDFGGLNAPLATTPAKLHQAAAGQPSVWNTALQGRIHNCTGGRPEALVFVQIAQARNFRFDIKNRIVQGRTHEARRNVQCRAADRLFAVFHHHLVNPSLGGITAATEAHRATGLRLQTEGCDFDDVGHRAWQATIGHRQHLQLRIDRAQVFHESRQARQVALIFVALNDRFYRRTTAPEIGATQGTYACNFHRLLLPRT